MISFQASLVALVLALALATPSARAAFTVPCAECEDTRIQAAPASGMWRDPEASGTGFMLQVQGSLLMGSYFGYDSEGKPLWYIFNGQLQQDEEPPFAHKVTAPLERLEGGTCLGCEYSAPTVIGDVGTISLVFTQRSFGTVSINGSEPVGITPLVLGHATSRDFEPGLLYAFPDLGGAWSIALEDPKMFGFWGRKADIVQISNKSIIRDDAGNVVRTNHFVDRYDGLPPDFVGVGHLSCVKVVGRIECRLSLNTYYPGREFAETLTFPVAPANLTDNRIVAVHPELGIRLEMFRIGYD
jgi:hypothetical protein